MQLGTVPSISSAASSGRGQSPSPEPSKPEHRRGDSSSGGGSDVGDEDKSTKSFDPTDVFNMDWRSFVCKTWHLEPTVR